ncbi:MAG: porin [Deltaproteobacteria bacterium]|nr:porin [Deltaproteobacteria bacterium]
MKKAVMAVVLAVGFLLSLNSGFAQEPKPLAPGWLSLDSSVGVLDKQIEQGKGSIEKALGIAISGFVDASYTGSSNRPRAPRNISGRYFDKDHGKVVFNDFNLTLEKPEKDWGVGFKLVGDFGRTAELLREATLWGTRLQDEPSAELREAFITFTIPIGAGLQVKGGKFVTLMGTEVIPAPGSPNPNISRSFAFNFAIPLTHTGVLFSYPVASWLTLMGGPVTGWDNPRDNNSSPSFHGGLTFTPAELFSLTSSIMVGPEQRHNISNQRFTWSNVATIKPTAPLTLFIEYTLGHEENAPTPTGTDDSPWHALAAIASYDWTDRFNTALRGEVFWDKEAARTCGALAFSCAGFAGTSPLNSLTLGEITLTAAYKFTAKLLGRFELRQDWADERVFQKRSSSADKNQTTLALQAIYTF